MRQWGREDRWGEEGERWLLDMGSSWEKGLVLVEGGRKDRVWVRDRLEVEDMMDTREQPEKVLESHSGRLGI